MHNLEGIVQPQLEAHVRTVLNAPAGMSPEDLTQHLKDAGCPSPEAALYAARVLEGVEEACDHVLLTWEGEP